MKKNRLAVRGAVLTACAGLLGGLLACSGDDTTTPAPTPDAGADGSHTVADAGDASTANEASTSDGSLADGSVTDADSSTDGSTAEASATDGSTDGSSHDGSHDGSSTDGSSTDGSVTDASSTDGSSTDGSATDGESDASMGSDSGTNDSGDGALADAAADVMTPPPAPVDLCPTLQAIWGNLPLNQNSNWPAEILVGPPSTPGVTGFAYQQECALYYFPPATIDFGNWVNQMTAFEYQIFGCPEDDAGITFGLIPAELQGTLLTTAQLALIGDTFVQSVSQAVANENGLLTPAQSAEIAAQVAYAETTWSPQVNSSENDFSNCSEAGTEAGTDAGGSD
jgi:hypothetical protein